MDDPCFMDTGKTPGNFADYWNYVPLSKLLILRLHLGGHQRYPPQILGSDYQSVNTTTGTVLGDNP